MLHDSFYLILFFPCFGIYEKIIVFFFFEKTTFAFEMFGQTTINCEILATFKLLNPTLIQNHTPTVYVNVINLIIHSLVREIFDTLETLNKYAMYQFF